MERDRIKRYQVEEEYEFDRWVKEIPYLTFPADWGVKIIPPFNGAIVRFLVKKGNASASIYMDGYSELGCFGYTAPEPYWEIYPYEGDVYRVALQNTDELLKVIAESIDQQNKASV
jgi:hypothetical protein